MGMREIKTVTQIGANGAMGRNVSAIFASFGNAKVYMVSRSLNKSKKAVEKAVSSVRAESILKNLIPVDYSSLSECVGRSDLVFESVTEDISIKSDILKSISGALSESTIICTGTSGLSVTKLAETLPEHLRANYYGVHMFNPPYSMPLCEFCRTKYSSASLATNFKDYLERKLFRTVVEVSDSPAFLANRIGFAFINEAMLHAQKYKDRGGIDYIDAILGGFTGRSMAPLVTSDFVGLDIHKMIVDNIYANTQDYAHETFALPEFAQKLIDRDALGRKTNGGLYKMETQDNSSGNSSSISPKARVKRLTVYDVATDVYRDKKNYDFPFAKKMISSFRTGDYSSGFYSLINDGSFEAELCLSFLLKYIVYSLVTAQTVGGGAHSADAVMAEGFNWCPALAVIDALSAIQNVAELIKTRIPSISEAADIDSLLAGVEKSAYDYRQYFKAVK
ncbi:MAG: 3-hydroxyacyl-CoA dehydrogenase family protein [Oscillospiraceae bacterium]|nr:3-hydroxyacyl-CoA dehydrogenase family protein [Oscillospiraceae bacterium]